MINERPADASDDLLGRHIFLSDKGKYIASFRRRNPLPGYDVPEYDDYFRAFDSWNAAEGWLETKTGGTTLFDLSDSRPTRIAGSRE